MRVERRRRLLACVVPGLLAFGISQTWFRPGYVIATGDTSPPMRQGWYDSFASHWNDITVGTGSPSYTIVYLPEIIVKQLADAAGMSDGTTQRLLMTVLFGAGAAAVAYLGLSLGLSPAGAGLAGSLAVFNFYFLQVFPSPNGFAGVICAGLTGGLIVKAIRGELRYGAAKIALSTVGFGYIFINPPMLAVILAWLALAVILGLALAEEGRRGRLIRTSVCAVPLITLVNAWWAVPAVLALRGPDASALAFTAVTDVQAWAWAHARASLHNLVGLGGAWGWKEPSYFPYAARLDSFPFIALRYVLPATAFVAPMVALRSQRRLALWLATTALVSLWIAKGLHPPLGEVNLFLYRHLPGFGLLREPVSKALLVTLLCYAVLAGISLGRLVATPEWYRFTGAGLVVVLMLGAVYPLLNGDVIPDERPGLPSAHVQVPPYWDDLASFLNNAPGDGKVLVLPLNDYYQVRTTWGYYGADLTASLLIRRAVISQLPSGYFSPPAAVSSLLNYVQRASTSDYPANVSAALSLLDARYVIVRHDIDRAFPGRVFADPGTLRAVLDRAPGLRRVRTFGALDLYENVASEGVRVATRMLKHQGTPDGVGELAASLPAGDAFVDGVAADHEAVSIPVQAHPQSTISRAPLDVAAGRYRLVPLRAPMMRNLVLDRDRSGRLSVVVTDLTTFRLGSVELRAYPPISASADISDDAMIRLGERVLPIPERGSRFDAGPISGLGPTSLDVFEPGASERWRLPTLPGELGDCRRLDHRTMEQVGLDGQVVMEGEPTLRLKARDHSACVAVPVEPFRPDTPLRVAFEYRHATTGPPPRMCLWQEGPERCVPAPGLDHSSSWREANVIVLPEPGTTALRLFLYADGDGRGTNVTEYRRGTISALRRTTVSFSPTETPEPSLDVPGGPIEASIATPFVAPPQAYLTDPLDREQLGDCRRLDHRTMEQVGLDGQVVMEGEPTLRLKARDHSACVAVPVEPFRPDTPLRVAFEYRHATTGPPPRMCLWQEGPERCVPAPGLDHSSSWREANVIVLPEPGTTALRLFLYADGDGRGTNVTEYRRVTTVAEPSAGLGLVPAGEGDDAPEVSHERTGPSVVRVRVRNAKGPFLLWITETYASGWKLLVEGSPAKESPHVRVNGYANGWIVPGGRDFEARIVYVPDTLATAAKGVSLVTFLLLLVMCRFYVSPRAALSLMTKLRRLVRSRSEAAVT